MAGDPHTVETMTFSTQDAYALRRWGTSYLGRRLSQADHDLMTKLGRIVDAGGAAFLRLPPGGVEGLVERWTALLLVRSGGHDEPIREMSEDKARSDVLALLGLLPDETHSTCPCGVERVCCCDDEDTAIGGVLDGAPAGRVVVSEPRCSCWTLEGRRSGWTEDDPCPRHPDDGPVSR